MPGWKMHLRMTVPSCNNKTMSLQWLEGGGLPVDPCQAQYLKAEHSNCEIIGVLCYRHPSAPDIVCIVVPSCLHSTLLQGSYKWEVCHAEDLCNPLREVYVERYEELCSLLLNRCLVCASRKELGWHQHPKLQPIFVRGPLSHCWHGCTSTDMFSWRKSVCYCICQLLDKVARCFCSARPDSRHYRLTPCQRDSIQALTTWSTSFWLWTQFFV